MDAEELEHFKEVLEAELETTQAELDKGLPSTENATCTHQADVASDAVSRMEAIPLRTLAEDKHRQILNALARIQRGDYDTCKACGGQINVERLKAHPYASLCVKCASGST